MTEKRNIAPILMAEDDADDRMLAERALIENWVANPLITVNNGEELLEYLYQKGKYSDPSTSPKPCFILLDLNMPKLDGREALKIIKEDEKLKGIPVVIMTTSKAEEDIFASYNEGANSYITKPITFIGLVKVIKALKDYWLEIVELPSDTEVN
ncbi:MAG TPA: response regulator [bacterium]|nr:response regulator [bacterium]